jgi:hypothetical protein
MELVDVRFSELSVEDITPNDVERGYYYPELVDYLELRALDVLTSFPLKNETRLVVVGHMEVVHDVNSFLIDPLLEFNIL